MRQFTEDSAAVNRRPPALYAGGRSGASIRVMKNCRRWRRRRYGGHYVWGDAHPKRAERQICGYQQAEAFASAGQPQDRRPGAFSRRARCRARKTTLRHVLARLQVISSSERRYGHLTMLMDVAGVDGLVTPPHPRCPAPAGLGISGRGGLRRAPARTSISWLGRKTARRPGDVVALGGRPVRRRPRVDSAPRRRRTFFQRARASPGDDRGDHVMPALCATSATGGEWPDEQANDMRAASVSGVEQRMPMGHLHAIARPRSVRRR